RSKPSSRRAGGDGFPPFFCGAASSTPGVTNDFVTHRRSLLEGLAMVEAWVGRVHFALEAAAIRGLGRVGEGGNALPRRLPAHSERLEAARGQIVLAVLRIRIDDRGPLARRIVAAREQEKGRKGPNLP